ncbi:MAG: preprotein translocase subunit SecE [Bacillota bacterium]|nr:preprotein translocase subunit SecE [Bacillota bacterium]
MPTRRRSDRQANPPKHGPGRPTGPLRPRRKGLLGYWDRLRHFIADLRSELKRVVWPNKQRMIQSSAIVFAIVIASVLLIGTVDFIVRNSLIAAGFDMPRTLETEAETPATTAAPPVMETETEAPGSDAAENDTTTAEGTEGS